MTVDALNASAAANLPVGRTQIDISVECGDWTKTGVDVETLSRRAAEAALATEGPGLGHCELSIVLSDDDTVRDLNRKWRGRDSSTNVLAFPAGSPVADGQPRLLGDVIVAFGVAKSEAVQDGIGLSDHLAHLVVHGTLHLLGYDHQEDSEAEAMEGLETRILAGMGIADPYADGNG